jgi:hypothetical protein
MSIHSDDETPLDDVLLQEDEPIDESLEQSLEQDTEKTVKMSNALNKILDSSFKTKPILSLARDIEKSLNNHKLEEKALKILLASKKTKLSLKQVPAVDAREKSLRKIATRGVVQLFNAIKSSQKVKETKVKPQNPVWMSNESENKSLDKKESWDTVMEETAPL